MFGENVTQSTEQGDEVAYLKIILDSLVRRRSLFENADVDLNRQFLRELKDSVEATLRGDSQINEEVRNKVITAFYVLIDNYAKQVGVLP